jgi:hypothetical protein
MNAMSERLLAEPVAVMVPLEVAPTPIQASRTPDADCAPVTLDHVAPQPLTAEMAKLVVETSNTSTSPAAGVSVTEMVGLAAVRLLAV